VWHGAFALALASGLPEDRALRHANAAAALKVGRIAGDMPTQAEVSAMLATAPV